MFARLLPRHGVLFTTIMGTITMATFSMLITSAIITMTGGTVTIRSIIIAASCPTILATPMFSVYFRLIDQLNTRGIELQRRNKELQYLLSQVKELTGLIPICASCKKIRDDRGYWDQVDEYLMKHSKAKFTHGICPECCTQLYPELLDDQQGHEYSGTSPVD